MRMTSTKFFAALIIVAANIIRSRYGIDLGIDDQLANDFAGLLMASIVWLVPNKPKAKPAEFHGENV